MYGIVLMGSSRAVFFLSGRDGEAGRRVAVGAGRRDVVRATRSVAVSCVIVAIFRSLIASYSDVRMYIRSENSDYRRPYTLIRSFSRECGAECEKFSQLRVDTLAREALTAYRVRRMSIREKTFFSSSSLRETIFRRLFPRL